MLDIIQLGDPRLEILSKKVTNPNDPKIQKIIKDMLEVLDSVKDHSAGLSAPQVGENLQIAICRRTDLEKDMDSDDPTWEVMINPEITKKSEVRSEFWEGCLSINQGDLFGKVERPQDVTVEYIDINGKAKKLGGSKFFSHVIQHEFDHLKGVLFISYIPDPTKLYNGEELEKLENN